MRLPWNKRPAILALCAFWAVVLPPAAFSAAADDSETDRTLAEPAKQGADNPPAPSPPAITPAPKQPKKKFHFTLLDKKAKITYSRAGLQLDSPAKNYRMNIRWRSQIRYSYPFDKPPRTVSQYERPGTTEFGWRRARLKVGGNAIRPGIEYYLEHDLINNELLELYMNAAKYEWLQVRFGQWKAEYGRSRAMSSGKLQFVDRSILSPLTTIERQPGIELRGHVKPGTRAESWYFLGVFGGNGPGQGFFDGDGHPMYVARYQWNFLGRDLPFSASDVEHHEQAAASLAVAASTNRSRYTAFSGSGGTQLEGYVKGTQGQYSLRQAMAEFALKYRGLSIQNENHWKQIGDNVSKGQRDLRGSYLQAGYFPRGLLGVVPKMLEVGYRYSFLDPNAAVSGDLQQEHSFVINHFFEGHDNKLTFDVGRISMAQAGGTAHSTIRYRFQWDVHF